MIRKNLINSVSKTKKEAKSFVGIFYYKGQKDGNLHKNDGSQIISVPMVYFSRWQNKGDENFVLGQQANETEMWMWGYVASYETGRALLASGT